VPEVVGVATDHRRIERLLEQEYRIACPRGHVSLEPAATTPTVYCRSCGCAYDYDDLRDRS